MVIIITGKYVKELRESIGISQAELAKRVGVSQAHVAKIESEKVDPRLSTINKVLSVLKTNKKVRCRDLMVKNIVFASPDDKIKKVVDLMRKFNISQLPVIKNNFEVGSIRESTIVKNLDKNLQDLRVEDIMEEPFPIVSSEDAIEVVRSLLDFHPAVLVTEKGSIAGLITKSDLLSLL